MTVFRNRVFVEVISRSRDEIILDLGLMSLQEKGEGDLTPRHRKTQGEIHVKVEAETAVMRLQVKER